MNERCLQTVSRSGSADNQRDLAGMHRHRLAAWLAGMLKSTTNSDDRRALLLSAHRISALPYRSSTAAGRSLAPRPHRTVVLSVQVNSLGHRVTVHSTLEDAAGPVLVLVGPKRLSAASPRVKGS